MLERLLALDWAQLFAGASPLDWAAYACVFAAALAGCRGLLLVAELGPAARWRAQERVRRHTTAGSDPVSDSPGILIDAAQRAGLLAQMGEYFGGRKLELFLYRAGLKWSVARFVGLCGLFALAGGGLGASLHSTLLTLALPGLGALPILYASLCQRARMRLFEQQLPDALDLICRALRAGISLEFGLRSVSEELADPIGAEFGLVADEVSLGLDIRQALANLATRMNTNDMPFLVNAITIQRETGGNLAEILDNLARIIRDRIKFYGKVKALVAQVNLTANLLALMPLAFAGAMLVVSPGYLDPLFQPEGRIYLYASAVMVPIGWLACKKIASIDI
jgi:tight adherence protein B